jgi:putative NADH-flavin reductase
MTQIAIIGATGYAGANIATEAVSRGHSVISVSRNAPADPPDGVEVRTGSIADPAVLEDLFADADVVVIATRARADGQTPLADLVPSLLDLAAAHGTRVGFVGGAGSLRVAPGGPRLIDTPEFPELYKPEASAHADVLAALRGADTDAEWFYLSPAATFGAHNPGHRTGSYRVGDDVLVSDADGKSEISGADLAVAVIDEIEHPAHHNKRFAVAY